MDYAELHCHSYYSFHDGASSLEELLLRAKELGYRALAVTEHDNLCGAMRFAQLADSLEMRGIIGTEITLKGGHHLTLLARDRKGYGNLCRLITASHASGERNEPELPPELLPEHAAGLIALSGCPRGELSQLVNKSRVAEARNLVKKYLDWFGTDNYYIELQHNLAFGDTGRVRDLLKLSEETGAKVAATGNVHYHVRERHRLQDCLVAVKHCKNLEETHRERRPNSEYYLRPVAEMESLFRECPQALKNTLEIAESCAFDLTRDLGYAFPDYPTPPGHTPESYLEKLCHQAAVRRYGSITPAVQKRLDEEFRLIRKFNLAGFLLMYHEVIKLGREVMIEQGLSDPSLTLEENPPGRGRGSSVALLVGYLIGLSHIDPLQYDLSLERFLPDDIMTNVPDIDLDFPRSIREDLILRTHEKWGWEHAALTGTIATYQIKGAVRDLGKALGLPETEIDQLAKQADWGSAKKLGKKMERMPNFRDKIDAPVWRDLIRLAAELDGFPKYMGQHPGGMILSSSPLTEIVPVQRGAIEGRYVCQWDKDSIDDAGFVKIDFLALGALSQMQEAIELIKERNGERIDMSRIDFEDTAVYDMLCKGDTIGIFQVESAAQMQTITRLQPRNLLDMAHEVGAVRPGVGVNHGVQEYLARRSRRKPVTYDCPLEQRALERTLGVVLFQDQVNQLAIDVAGFAPSEADRLRRAFGRKHNTELIENYRRKFLEGARKKGVSEEEAEKVFKKFNGMYMFPESHAFAFGVTAYQAAWLKYHYPLEFFVAIFNQQPMGFYNLETLKEDAGRHGIRVLNPDINRSGAKCVIEQLDVIPSSPSVIPAKAGIQRDGVVLDSGIRQNDTLRGEVENQYLRLGFLNVTGLGKASAEAIEAARGKGGAFRSIGDFLERTGVLEEVALNLAGAGAFDGIESNRRKVKWEIGLRYRPINSQIPLPLPVEQDLVALDAPGDWERMQEEYNVLSLFPAGHVMSHLRHRFNGGFRTSRDIENLSDGAAVTTAGLVIRRQRPQGKVVYITLEDEFGHIPCMVFGKVYERHEHKFRSPFLVVKGRLSRREGTCNLVINQVEPLSALEKALPSKDFR
ncbi:MAG: DNA polymerase III subunit alpha [Dehalococcoidales bacterium]|nr:DNA polymerase III subunit alpha [Dehalococcoidales bacterium]